MEEERKQSPGELVKSDSHRYMRMIKGPAYKVKLIIKGPWAHISLPARLNTYEGALLHSLSGGEGGRGKAGRRRGRNLEGWREGNRHVIGCGEEDEGNDDEDGEDQEEDDADVMTIKRMLKMKRS